jgi:hypothetical protein
MIKLDMRGGSGDMSSRRKLETMQSTLEPRTRQDAFNLPLLCGIRAAIFTTLSIR